MESDEKIQAWRKQLTQAEKRIAELDRLFVKIYEDNAKEKLSDERFSMMSGNYVGAPDKSSGKRQQKIGIFNFFLFYGHRPNCRAFLLDKTRYKPPGIILLL